MKKKHVIILVVVILLLIAPGIALWYFVFSKKPKISPKVAAAQTALPNGYVVDPATGIVTLKGYVVGRDNGDDSWTSTGGSIIDYNGNFISNSPMSGTALTSFVVGSGTAAAPPANVYTVPASTSTTQVTAQDIAELQFFQDNAL